MKETYYFSHDYNASQDPKIFNMMSELGWEGYGLFWAIIEKLAEANGKLSLNDIKGFAFAWKIDSTIIKSLVNDFQLFDNDNEFFWSNRLIEHLNNRQKMANIRSKAGKIGGLASAKQRSSNRQAIVKQNQAKERKGKESKIKEITIMQPAVATSIPFDSTDYINKLITNKQRHVHIIGLYWQTKNYKHPSQEAANEALKRDFRVAKGLSGYPDNYIIGLMNWLEKQSLWGKLDYEWKLTTIVKKIDDYIKEIN